MASVLDIAKKINKSWKDSVLTDGSFIPECDRVPIGTLGASFPLYGGLPCGNIIVASGQEHSGKSLFAALAMAEYQKKFPDRTSVYIDSEQNLRTQLGFMVKMTGLQVDEDHFLRYDTSGKSCEEVFRDIIELEQAENCGLICLDSIVTLVSQSDLDNDFTKDSGLRSSVAKATGKFLKMMLMYLPKRNNILLIINQVRDGGKTYNGAQIWTEPGGWALKFLPSMKLRFGTRKFTLGDKTDLTKGDEADGFRLSFAVTKNRLGPVNRGGGFLTFRYDTGLDADGDMLEVALKFGFIDRPNLQTYVLVNLDTGEIYKDSETGDDCKFRGKQALIDYLNTHPEFKHEYIEMLDRNISKASGGGKSLLDDDSLQEILEQEDSVEKNLSAEEKAEKDSIGSVS